MASADARPKPTQAPPRIQHPVPGAGRRRRPLPGQAHRRRRRRRSRPTSSATATTILRAVVRYRGPGGGDWREAADDADRRPHNGVRWAGEFEVDAPGRWEFTIEAWTDVVRHLARRAAAQGRGRPGGPLGRALRGRRAAASAAGARRGRPTRRSTARSPSRRRRRAGDASRRRARRPSCSPPSSAPGPHGDDARSTRRCPLEVDRVRARFGAWYELFPRSWGGLQGVEAAASRGSPSSASTSLYLPPIHPIGAHEPQGPQQHARRRPRRPRLAVGDRRRRGRPRRRAPGARHDRGRATRCRRPRAEHGMDVALDFAIQCSADHPWLTEHPEWFHHRPDGTLKYAENPPKKYQDIYNFNWDTRGLARRCGRRCCDVVLHWVDAGVKVFRVDNPHTKPIAVLGVADRRGPRATTATSIFLAEAFTRRAVMRAAGQGRLHPVLHVLHVEELALGADRVRRRAGDAGEREYFRPNFFANTPDILTRVPRCTAARRRSRAARARRDARARPTASTRATRTSRTCRSARAREEYLDSEKYEIKQRALDGPLLPMIRAAQPGPPREPGAAAPRRTSRFLDTAQRRADRLRQAHGGNAIICVVNLDPHERAGGRRRDPRPPRRCRPPSRSHGPARPASATTGASGGNYVRLRPVGAGPGRTCWRVTDG